MHSRFIALAVLLTWAAVASGQTSKSESAEADAAMERAKRAAAGPMKAIQQAAKMRRKGEPDVPLPVPAPGVPAAVQAASASALPLGVVVSERSAVAAVVTPPPLVLDDTPAALKVTEVAPLSRAAAAAAAVSLPALTTAPPVPDLPPPLPKVLSMQEPVIPPRLLLQEGGAAEVEVEFSLRADGSVQDVRLLPPVPRTWQRYITAAMAQWRFEPMSGPATHRVRLVFGADAR